MFWKKTVKPSITPEEQASRRKAVDTASGSLRLEGFILDPDIVALNERYVAGEFTREELTAAIKKAVG
jgi:hypothetical protein